ncbi:MAG: ABC transporter substrate-binding protein [Hyphomicrobium sp.]|uniref:ABC transporter substrate-binding protein n=1 Tax=Hyphomicrobium sp. TaxID=82 RepID=UPI003D0D87A8
MRRRALLAVAALAMAAALGAPALAEIRVGVAVPLSGRMAGVGLAMERALEAAIAEANAAGGVLGDTLTLLVEDDGCARATAEGAAAVLIAQKPAVVIGHPCANAAAATATLYGSRDVLLIAVGPRHPDVTRVKPAPAVSPLRLAGRDDRQGAAAAAWLLAHAPARRIAIIHDRTAYARAIADGAAAALAAEGAAAAPLVLPIVANRHDYADALAKLNEGQIEAVLFAGYADEGAIVVAGLERLGLAVPVLGSDVLATERFADIAEHAKIAIEVLLPVGLAAIDALPGDAERRAAEARGAFEAWLATVQATGSLDARAVSSAMRDRPIATRTLGEIRFDQDGDLDAPAFAAASARAGRWVLTPRQ